LLHRFAATSETLSDKAQYPLFWRTAPSDKHQSAAAASVVAAFGWDTVGTFATKDSYADGLASEFETVVRSNGVKVTVNERVEQYAAGSLFDASIQTVKEGGSAVNLMVSIGDDAVNMMTAANANGMAGPG